MFIEFIGYLWHRFIEHGFTSFIKSNVLRRGHYEHHEIHYATMADTEKYIPDGWFDGDTWPWFIPVGTVLIIYIVLYKLAIISLSTCYTGLIVSISDAYLNSYINQAYHIKNHWLNYFGWFRRHKFYHKLHHFYNCNYGIATFIMDRIFGTLITNFSGPKENLFDGYDYQKIYIY